MKEYCYGCKQLVSTVLRNEYGRNVLGCKECGKIIISTPNATSTKEESNGNE